MNLEKDLSGICGAAGLDGPVICPYDWRQTVEYSAEAWVAPRIWQHVGDKKKARWADALHVRCYVERSGCATIQSATSRPSQLRVDTS